MRVIENQIKANRLTQILESINNHHKKLKIIKNPIAFAFISMKILSYYDKTIEQIKRKTNELDMIAGKEDISGTMKFYELIALTHLLQNKIQEKW